MLAFRIALVGAALLPLASCFTPYIPSVARHGIKNPCLAGRSPPTMRTGLGMRMMAEPAIRIGHGWDIHRLASLEEAGQACVIGGVTVKDFDLGTVAHSDGDVLYHSTVDAILGALTMPDIGQLFPDTDPKWKGCDSSAFMEEAWRLMDERGYQISNLDITLVLQKPRVSPIKDKMKENVVKLLRTTDDRVNIKARTHEKVDSIGEARALACHAVLLMEKK
uniref:2-C-methyl-D-erythritol 2,4-cyclodiphosphate synthase n=1 Tax=Hemiselmis andersenii TaxID=464988 RepID=A0A6U4KKU4_HEMAN|mmetsp:Transcript_22628/g.52519  ORF Transcript_22628/g.52519 Transcript_22628/m.52519 type:complete len:221 (+) Transcript_22628:74-736(+)